MEGAPSRWTPSCSQCGYDLSQLPARGAFVTCPECGTINSMVAARQPRSNSPGKYIVPLGLALSHAIIIVGAGHGAAPIGFFYAAALTGNLSMGKHGYSAAPIIAGMLGVVAALVSIGIPWPRSSRVTLIAASGLLLWAWVYFQFRVSEGAGEFTMCMSIPFLGFVGWAGWYTRRLWWLW
jgi:hypothetical protein